MKIFASLMGLIALVWIYAICAGCLQADYDFCKKAQSYWSLADKSSTLASKSQNVDRFVSALEALDLRNTYNATLYETADNSFDKNFEALVTLRDRLREIKGLDQSSLAYQQAISQITAQEQNQAEEMTGTIYGCWLLKYHPLIWSWHLGVNITLLVAFIIGTVIVTCLAWSTSY